MQLTDPIVQCLRAHSGALEELAAREKTVPPIELYHLVVGWVHLACSQILKAENAGVERAQVRAALAPARAIHAKSRWVRRLQEWPRGYQGDFETIEQLMKGLAHPDLSSVHGCCEFYALNSPAAQQHRHKIDIQSEIARDYLLEGRDVLSIGCGGCLDLQRALVGLQTRSHLFLNDIDDDALALARRRLIEVGIAPRMLRGNVLSGLRQIRDRRFGLILAGGLFDYLEPRVARFVVRQCYRMVTGRSGPPYRVATA